MSKPPKLDDIRSWPATVTVTQAATALGVSRSQLYELIKRDEAPIATLRVRPIRVITASLIRLLEATD